MAIDDRRDRRSSDLIYMYCISMHVHANQTACCMTETEALRTHVAKLMLSSAVFITHRCQALLPRGLAALRSGRVAGVCWVDSDRRLAFFALRENGLCCSAFPMFVPSLFW